MAVGLKVYVEPLPQDISVDSLGPDAFDELYRRCHRDLLALCRRLLCGRGDAEALAQEAFLRAWMSLDRYSTARPFWPWLATIARRLCIDHRRRLQRERNHAHAGVMTTTACVAAPSPEEALDAGEEYRSAYAALRLLKPAEQRVITLRDVNGWSYEEIARFEGVTVESIRGALKRARTSLRRSYANVAGGVPAAFGVGALRGRVARLVGRRTPSSTPALLTLPTVHDAVVGMAALAVALGGAAGAPALERPRAVDVAEATTSVEAPSSVTSAAADEATAVPGSAGRTARPNATGAEPSRPLVPGGLLADGSDTPEAGATTSFTVSPNVEEDGTVFATATVIGCPMPPCAAVFRSTDAGTSWARLPATGFVGGRVLLAPTYPRDGRIFVAGPAGLQVSTNGGTSFATLAAVPGSAAVSPGFAEDDPRIIVASSPLWEYRDDTELAAPAPLVVGPSTAAGGVAFGPTAGGRRLYVGGTTVDTSGRQVATVFSCEDAICDRRAALGTVPGAPSIAVSSRSASDDVVFAWRGTALFRSTDGGRSFGRTVLPVAGTVAEVTFSPSGVVIAALTAAHGVPRGGLFASSDDGATWHRLGAGTALDEGVTAVAVVGGGRLLAAPALQGGGGVLCSSDAGVTWSARCTT